MPSSDDINSAFGDQWGLLLTVLQWVKKLSQCLAVLQRLK